MYSVRQLSMREQCAVNFLFNDYDSYDLTDKLYDENLVLQLSEKYKLPTELVASHIVMFIYPEYINFEYSR